MFFATVNAAEKATAVYTSAAPSPTSPTLNIIDRRPFVAYWPPDASDLELKVVLAEPQQISAVGLCNVPWRLANGVNVDVRVRLVGAENWIVLEDEILPGVPPYTAAPSKMPGGWRHSWLWLRTTTEGGRVAPNPAPAVESVKLNFSGGAAAELETWGPLGYVWISDLYHFPDPGIDSRWSQMLGSNRPVWRESLSVRMERAQMNTFIALLEELGLRAPCLFVRSGKTLGVDPWLDGGLYHRSAKSRTIKPRLVAARPDKSRDVEKIELDLERW